MITDQPNEYTHIRVTTEQKRRLKNLTDKSGKRTMINMLDALLDLAETVQQPTDRVRRPRKTE